MTDAILSKRQNYRLWQGGAFGNKLRAWNSIEKWRADLQGEGFHGRQGVFALRTLLPSGGGPCRFGLRSLGVMELVNEWCRCGLPRDAIMINEQAPDESIVVQGEYLNDVCVVDGKTHWGYFYFSRVRMPMRPALTWRRPEVAYDLQANLMIREAMTPSSYEDWQVLLEQYPGHVLEVSIYSRCLGDIPGRNALVWEVRRY